MEQVPIGTFIATLGFGMGILFGAVAHRTSFCTMGALSDIVFMGNWNRFRSWMLATAIAIIGTQYLYQTGAIDLSRAIYLTPNLGWFGAILGGVLFGFGMTLGSGCGNKTLVRVGAGNLKSLVVMMFLGIFAYMTLRGLIGLARVEMEGVTMIDLTTSGLKNQGIPDFLAAMTPLGLGTASLVTTIIVGGGLLVFCFKSAAFRSSPLDISSGVLIGLLVVLAWYVTGVVGADEFEPVALESFTFIAPVGNSIQYIMTFSGATINFGIATVGGIIFGSFISAKARNEFHIEAFSDSADMARHIVGGSLMGVGGVLSLGCTVGQGITGMSTLAVGSLIALLSIIVGAVFGLKYLEEESLGGALKALFARG
ncbi:MAG: YeeE/YedE family protein [Proteobacteria bacterium]|nr:YeeE/YedE family protein [Pseudomonadota bacterium]